MALFFRELSLTLATISRAVRDKVDDSNDTTESHRRSLSPTKLSAAYTILYGLDVRDKWPSVGLAGGRAVGRSARVLFYLVGSRFHNKVRFITLLGHLYARTTERDNRSTPFPKLRSVDNDWFKECARCFVESPFESPAAFWGLSSPPPHLSLSLVYHLLFFVTCKKIYIS